MLTIPTHQNNIRSTCPLENMLRTELRLYQIMYVIVHGCAFDCVCIWQNLSIKDTLRLGYDILYNGTSLLKTICDGVAMVPHR